MPIECRSQLSAAQGQHLGWQRRTLVIGKSRTHCTLCGLKADDIRYRGQGAAIDFAGGEH